MIATTSIFYDCTIFEGRTVGTQYRPSTLKNSLLSRENIQMAKLNQFLAKSTARCLAQTGFILPLRATTILSMSTTRDSLKGVSFTDLGTKIPILIHLAFLGLELLKPNGKNPSTDEAWG